MNEHRQENESAYIPQVVLEERARQYAQVAHDDEMAAKSSEAEWLVFNLDGGLFALPMKALDEIASVSTGAILPGSPPQVIGLMNLRAENVLLMNTPQLLGISQAGRSRKKEKQPVLILKDEHGQRTGFSIDAIESAENFADGFFEETALSPHDRQYPVDATGDLRGKTVNRVNVRELLNAVNNLF